MIKRGLVLDHSKSPCEESFIPDKKVKFVFTVITASTLYISVIYCDVMFVLKVVQMPCPTVSCI
jgi:hypothetical protein